MRANQDHPIQKRSPFSDMSGQETDTLSACLVEPRPNFHITIADGNPLKFPFLIAFELKPDKRQVHLLVNLEAQLLFEIYVVACLIETEQPCVKL